MFGQLDEHTAGRGRVKKGNALSFRSDARCLVDQPKAGTATAVERSVEIVDGRLAILTELADKSLDQRFEDEGIDLQSLAG